MSIIIQAGYKSSKSKQLMEKLYERGLSRPADSYTHKMTPEQVSETLYKVLVRENMSSANEKMVDNIMTDFLLANLDSENWGWESNKNLTSLEYWGQIEPDVRFILVFDHPSYLLNKVMTIAPTVERVDQAMTEWIAYHQKMLNVLETHQGKTILIEGVCAVDSIGNLGEQIKSITNSLRLKSKWQTEFNTITQEHNKSIVSETKANVVADHINTEILKKYPEAIKLFNILLNKASMKSSEPIYKTKQTELNILVEALQYLKNQEDSSQSLLESTQELNDLRVDNEDKQQRIYALELQRQEVKTESSQIIRQLHQTQEVLEEKEQYRKNTDNENKMLKLKISELNKIKQDLENKTSTVQKKNETYKVELSQLQQQIKQSHSKHSDNETSEQLKQEHEMLLKQLHYTQEELEKYYLENQSLASKNKIDKQFSTQPVVQPAAVAPVYYGAADRVKNDLPYRLGSQMVKAKKPKDLALLPLALVKEYREFQNTENNRVNLPSLDEYQDIAEADKIKKHLSYRFGNLVVSSTKSPNKILMMPIKLSKEIFDFKRKK